MYVQKTESRQRKHGEYIIPIVSVFLVFCFRYVKVIQCCWFYLQVNPFTFHAVILLLLVWLESVITEIFFVKQVRWCRVFFIFQVKVKAQTLAEMNAFMQRRIEEDDKLKNEIDGILDQLNK